MPTYGIVMRDKPWLVVLRGFDANQPSQKTAAYPVKPSEVDVIKSGMVISIDDTTDPANPVWVKGWAATRIPYVALQDGNTYNVVSANSLVGYSCLGNFVLQTGYFKTGESYPIDTPVTPDGTTGDIKPTTTGSGEPIMGYITAPVDDLLDGGATGYPSISGVVDGDVVAFQTAWLTNQV